MSQDPVDNTEQFKRELEQYKAVIEAQSETLRRYILDLKLANEKLDSCANDNIELQTEVSRLRSTFGRIKTTAKKMKARAGDSKFPIKSATLDMFADDIMKEVN